MEQLPGLPEAAFDKADRSPDAEFYAYPRLVTHIDDGAIAAVTRVYRAAPAVRRSNTGSDEQLGEPFAGRCRVRLGRWPRYERGRACGKRTALYGGSCRTSTSSRRSPLADNAFDGACLCVSVQDLQRPVEVFRDVARLLRPGAPFVVSFSNRCFPTKAVAIWQGLSSPDQQRLIGAYMRRAGFINVAEECRQYLPAGDPLWVVIGIAS